MSKLYRTIQFKRNCGNCGGSLVQFQEGEVEANALPFEIGKVLVMSDIQTDDTRGNHAHHETEEILVVLAGGCIVDLDDGCGVSEQVRLTASGYEALDSGGNPGGQQPATSNQEEIKALLLFPHIWRVMRDFSPGTVLLVVANMKYDEADYIRDRPEFERLSKKWTGLGGSAPRSAGAGVLE